MRCCCAANGLINISSASAFQFVVQQVQPTFPSYKFVVQNRPLVSGDAPCPFVSTEIPG